MASWDESGLSITTPAMKSCTKKRTRYQQSKVDRLLNFPSMERNCSNVVERRAVTKEVTEDVRVTDAGMEVPFERTFTDNLVTISSVSQLGKRKLFGYSYEQTTLVEVVDKADGWFERKTFTAHNKEPITFNKAVIKRKPKIQKTGNEE